MERDELGAFVSAAVKLGTELAHAALPAVGGFSLPQIGRFSLVRLSI